MSAGSATPWYSLGDKTVWITGGAGHLGTPITEALDRCCRKTICIDMKGRAEAMVVEEGLTRTVPVTLDVSESEGLVPFVENCAREHGVPDGLLHLAVASSAGKSLEELSAAEFQRTFDLALTSTFVLCREVAERMKPRGTGSIVLFSSMYGVVSPDPRIYRLPLKPNPIDYGASKAAILQMTRYFAVHYAPSGIRFNSITPGPFPNPSVQRDQPGFIRELEEKTPLGRVGRNHEIVGPSLFLLTDSASFVAGHALVVDGGWTAW